jgi:hypothetical protein
MFWRVMINPIPAVSLIGMSADAAYSFAKPGCELFIGERNTPFNRKPSPKPDCDGLNTTLFSKTLELKKLF